MPSSPTKPFGRLSEKRQRQRRTVLSHRRVRPLLSVRASDKVSYFYNARGQLFKSTIRPEKKGEWTLSFVQFVRGKPVDVGRGFLEMARDRSSITISWVDKASAVLYSIDPSAPIKDKGIDFFRAVVEASIKIARQEKIFRLNLIANPTLAKYYSKYGFRFFRDYSPGRVEMSLDFSPRGDWQAPSHTF